MNTTAEVVASTPARQRPLVLGLVLSLVYGIVAVLICGIAWGLVAYFTNSIFLIGAILIGAIVSFAVTAGFSRLNWFIAIIMFVPAVAFTVVSVLAGDFLYYTLVAARELQLGLTEAATGVAANFAELFAGQDAASSLIFAGIGALVGFYLAMKK